MIFIILSISCSVLVSVLLKIAKHYGISINQAIAFNYSIAAVLCFYFYKPDFSNISEAPVHIYLILGVLLPLLFVILARSVKYTGIVRTDIAQRLSLLIPLFASFLLFNEVFSVEKTIAISIGLISILCTIPWQNTTESTLRSSWLYPLLVFVGMGVIDVLFKQVSALKVIPFTTSLLIIFLIALSISMLTLAYHYLFKNYQLGLKNIFFGLVLGFFNFGNILFYLKAHRALKDTPSLVFSAMNIGVIALGSLVGLWFFKERLSKINYFGIMLALVSILMLAFSG